MKIRIIINSYRDTRTQEEMERPFYIKGQISTSEVWRGDLDILSDREYLTKISIIADGISHPICDIPFGVGIGHWMWIPGELGEEISEIEEGTVIGPYPGLFGSLQNAPLPAMILKGGRVRWIVKKLRRKLQRRP